jgi:hypothetical protein
MDSRLRYIAARQEDVVAAWQLRTIGWTWDRVRHHAARGGWRAVHRGVYVLTSSAITQRQLWVAAVLTAPKTYLSHGSAGACYGFYRFEGNYEVVTRPGQGGRRRHRRLLVYRSKTLASDITRQRGIPVTTAARVLVDLAPGLTHKRLGRAFRESIRLGHTSARCIGETVERHAGRAGTARLRVLRPVTRASRITARARTPRLSRSRSCTTLASRCHTSISRSAGRRPIWSGSKPV